MCIAMRWQQGKKTRRRQNSIQPSLIYLFCFSTSFITQFFFVFSRSFADLTSLFHSRHCDAFVSFFLAVSFLPSEIRPSAINFLLSTPWLWFFVCLSLARMFASFFCGIGWCFEKCIKFKMFDFAEKTVSLNNSSSKETFWIAGSFGCDINQKVDKKVSPGGIRNGKERSDQSQINKRNVECSCWLAHVTASQTRLNYTKFYDDAVVN